MGPGDPYGRPAAPATRKASSYPARQPSVEPDARHIGRDQRTMTVQRVRRRPPLWVIAALSCSIALLIAGVVIAVSRQPPPHLVLSPSKVLAPHGRRQA